MLKALVHVGTVHVEKPSLLLLLQTTAPAVGSAEDTFGCLGEVLLWSSLVDKKERKRGREGEQIVGCGCAKKERRQKTELWDVLLWRWSALR